MQVTGRITGLQPTQRGGYSGRNGYIYTFDMAIDGPNGQIVGEIGSKAQNYPKNIGDEITVEVKQDGQYGNKFKAVNPQYGNQGQQGRQQPAPQGFSQAAQKLGNKKQGPDWDLKDYHIALQCCAKVFMEAQAQKKMTFDEAWLETRAWAASIWLEQLPQAPVKEPANNQGRYDERQGQDELDWMQEP